MAGESAREIARRHREKAERLTRAADKWERGADGEAATASLLEALPAQWTVLHDVRWPGRQRANIDHVVIGPAGVFVVDTKNWSGTVVVAHDVLRQNGRQREQTVANAAEAALAVARLVPELDVRLVVPVLCFVRDDDLRGWARDVMVCSTANLAAMLMTRKPVLDETSTATLVRHLTSALRAAASPSARPIGSAGSRAPRSPAPSATRRASRRGRSPGERFARLVVGLTAVVGVLAFQDQIGKLAADLFVPEIGSQRPGAPEPGPPARP